jgi:hypothetical protein
MHFIGARFADAQAASTALGEIRASVPVGPGDLALRPLGSTRYDVPSDDIVLAGRFEPGDVDEVVGILVANGGAILVQHPESRALQEATQPATPGLEARDARDARARESSTQTTDPVRKQRGTTHKRLRRPATPLRRRAAKNRRIRS